MFGNHIFRVLRKRIVLGFILTVSILYYLFNFINVLPSEQIVEAYDKPVLRSDLAFRWHSDVDSNATVTVTCRNSVQGKVLITDDKGYVCYRNNVLPSGCCDTNAVSTKHYSCETCHPGGCCSIYEYCISCCLHPDKKALLQSILGKASETFSVLFASVTDHFELCLTKCRTSSQRGIINKERQTMAYYYVDDYDGDNETFENDDQNIYVVKWLNDCYRTLALPNPLTEKLARKVNNQLANKVKGQIDNSVKVQLLYLLLGKDYMKANFPQCKHDPLLLEQPKMMPETKMAMLDDMRSWLIQQLYTIKHELGYDRSAETGTAPAELVSFQDEAQLVYTRELNNRVEELKANSMDNMSKGSSYLNPKTVVLGEALLAVGFRDPFEMAHILKTLQQTFFPLPGRLRSYVWSEFLFLRKGIKSNLIQSNIMKKTRLKFQLAVEDNSQNRKQSILQSEINKQIEDEVMGVYNHNLSLRSTDTDYHLLQAVKVLNLLYTYSQNFSSLYIYWLYPLQFCIDLDNIDEDEKLYHLAFHLDFFVTECPLSQSELFNTADQVLDSLKKLDPFLHEYLYDVCSKHVIADPKDFPEECYHLDKAEARKIFLEIAMVSETDVPPSRLAIIGDPAIFIRKWLATAFVSALIQPALFLFWDYMFLGKWDRRRLQDICLILLGLLKNWFYKAKNFDEIRQVFFDEPSRLYTNDIRSSWLHWQNQGSFDAIPSMNHNCIDSNLDEGGGKR